MMQLSKNTLISVGAKLLAIVLSAKILMLILWYFLPSDTRMQTQVDSYTIPYKRVNFANMLQPAKGVQQEQHHTIRNAMSIDNLILSGLYGNKNHGYAIIAKKSSPKNTHIVGVGESFEGYMLDDILRDHVVFKKGQKEYIVRLRKAQNPLAHVKKYIKYPRGKYDTSNQYNIRRSDIAYYSSNPANIWRDIGITELRKNGKITGFKVTRIRPHSKMAAIGLRAGDIIIKANNIALHSYKDAMNLYNKIDKIDTLDLIVLRNNQEKELVYELR